MITTEGMFSAVQAIDAPDMIVVRTRVKADAERLQEWLRTIDAPADLVTYDHSDYPWRVLTSRRGWAAYVADTAWRIDYGNFKDRVTREQGKPRHDVYAAVWATLLRLEHLDPHRRRDPLFPVWTDEDEQDGQDRCTACGSPIHLCDQDCTDPFFWAHTR